MSNIIAKDLKKRGSATENYTLDDFCVKRITSKNPYYPEVMASGQREADRHISWFSGWDIPNFHERKSKGELLPQTPFKSFSVFGGGSGSYIFRTGNWEEWWIEGNSWLSIDITLAPGEEELSAHVPTFTDKYVQEAAAAIYSSGFDALTFLAELASLKTLFKSLTTKLLKLKLPKNWRSLSNDWLEARYGVRTTIYDFKQLYDLVSKFSEPRRQRLSERKGTHSTFQNVKDTVSDPEGYYKLHTIVTDFFKVGLRGSVTADIEIPALQFNPLATAWELIPLSFVVDWVFSVGKAISAASFLALNSSYSASFGYEVALHRTIARYSGNYYGRYVSGQTIRTGEYNAKLRVRVPCSVPLSPHLTFNINSLKIIDLLGLVIQRSRR